MDDYKELFYRRQQHARQIDPGDMRIEGFHRMILTTPGAQSRLKSRRIKLVSTYQQLSQSLTKANVFSSDTIYSVNRFNGIWTQSIQSSIMLYQQILYKMVLLRQLHLMLAELGANLGK